MMTGIRAPPSHSFGVVSPEFAVTPRTTADEAGIDSRRLCGDFARRRVGVFIALVGLAGPLLKRWCKYTAT
jgi:hypothetical protein